VPADTDNPTELSLRRVLRQLVGALGGNWRELIVFGLFVFVPIGLLTALVPFDELELERLDDREALVALGLALITGLISMLGTVLYAGVIAGAVNSHREGIDRPLGEIARSLPYGRLMAADIALILVVAIGFVLLLVPGFVFLVWFALVAPAIEVEHRSVRSGLRRSRELVRPHFWKVAVLVWPAFLLQGTLEEAGEEIASDLLGGSWLSDWLGSVAGSMLAGPTFALVVVILFLELREAGYRS